MPSDLLVICYENDISFQKLTPSRCEELLEKGMIWNDPTTDPVSEAEPIIMFFPFSFPPDPIFQFIPLLIFILRDKAPFVFQAFIRPGRQIP